MQIKRLRRKARRPAHLRKQDKLKRQLRCKTCKKIRPQYSLQQTKDGRQQLIARCEICGGYLKYCRKSEVPAHVRANLSDDYLRSAIKYPHAHSEFEVQSHLLAELRNKGYSARGEVWADDRKARFDLVLFDKKQTARAIIEVKKVGSVNDPQEQIERYSQFGLPVEIIQGMTQAKTFLDTVDGKYGNLAKL